MTFHICLITPISRHPRYVYHPRFWARGGTVYERTGLGAEALSLSEAIAREMELREVEARHWLNGEIAAANFIALVRREAHEAAHQVFTGRAEGAA